MEDILRPLRKFAARFSYQLIQLYWFFRRPIILGVRVLVVREGKVLLVKKSYRSHWFLHGGRPERNETLADTACREVVEEAGVGLGRVELVGVFSGFKHYTSNHIVAFAGETATDGHVGSGEIDSMKWFSIESLPKDVAKETEAILAKWTGAQEDTCAKI